MGTQIHSTATDTRYYRALDASSNTVDVVIDFTTVYKRVNKTGNLVSIGQILSNTLEGRPVLLNDAPADFACTLAINRNVADYDVVARIHRISTGALHQSQVLEAASSAFTGTGLRALLIVLHAGEYWFFFNGRGRSMGKDIPELKYATYNIAGNTWSATSSLSTAESVGWKGALRNGQRVVIGGDGNTNYYHFDMGTTTLTTGTYTHRLDQADAESYLPDAAGNETFTVGGPSALLVDLFRFDITAGGAASSSQINVATVTGSDRTSSPGIVQSSDNLRVYVTHGEFLATDVDHWKVSSVLLSDESVTLHHDNIAPAEAGRRVTVVGQYYTSIKDDNTNADSAVDFYYEGASNESYYESWTPGAAAADVNLSAVLVSPLSSSLAAVLFVDLGLRLGYAGLSLYHSVEGVVITRQDVRFNAVIEISGSETEVGLISFTYRKAPSETNLIRLGILARVPLIDRAIVEAGYQVGNLIIRRTAFGIQTDLFTGPIIAITPDDFNLFVTAETFVTQAPVVRQLQEVIFHNINRGSSRVRSAPDLDVMPRDTVISSVGEIVAGAIVSYINVDSSFTEVSSA